MGGHIGGPAAAGETHGPAQEPDPIPRPLGHFYIPQGELADAFHWHRRRIDLLPEGQVRQNTDLAARVNALHVGGRVRLGVALGLGFPEGVGEKGIGSDHAGEDIVGGSVEDAVNFVNAVCCHALGQRVEDRNAAAHAGLE